MYLLCKTQITSAKIIIIPTFLESTIKNDSGILTQVELYKSYIALEAALRYLKIILTKF